MRAVEPISELREICQNTRVVKGRTEQHWISLFYRKLSIYFTWLVLHTSLNANNITTINFVLAIIGGVFIALGNFWLGLISVLILFVINLFDHVDGEVSRYHKSSSVKGQYFDSLTGDILHPFYFIGISIASFNLTGDPAYFVLCSLVIVFYFANCLVKDFSKEYENKQFHKSPMHSVSLIGKNPKTMIIFFGSSKHFTDLLIVFCVVFSQFSFVLVFLSVFVPLSFFFRLRSYFH